MEDSSSVTVADKTDTNVLFVVTHSIFLEYSIRGIVRLAVFFALSRPASFRPSIGHAFYRDCLLHSSMNRLHSNI
jgi:hypothetical protein